MLLPVDYFVDSRFADGIAGTKLGSVRSRTVALISFRRTIRGAQRAPHNYGTFGNFFGNKHFVSA